MGRPFDVVRNPTATSDERAFDVAIVGGGAIGLGIAWRTAARGLSVALIDDRPGSGASWAAAGMLAPVTEVHPGEEALLALNLASAEIYGDWVAELEDESGADVGYRRTGTLLVARDADDNAQLDEVYALQTRLGLEVERLRSRECRALEPALAPSVRGGIFVSGDHEVDNRALVQALQEACRVAGVEFVREKAMAVRGDERVDGVELANGETVSAGAVVIAAGSWSGSIGGAARAFPDVRPVKGQLLHLRGRPHAGLPTHVVRGIDCYAVPRGDGRVVVGATVEEQGFDQTITAGAVHELLRAAVELLPDIVEAELVEIACGLRPGTPTNSPVLGPTAVEGLFVATGHYRNGILLTPITANCMADLLATGSVPERLEPFVPERPAARTAS